MSVITPIATKMVRRDERRRGSMIGIGGSLSAPPLPHHRAYGAVHGGSRSCANTLGTGMGDRAILSTHWRARWRGLYFGRDTKDRGRCRPYSLQPMSRPRLRQVPPGGAVVFSTGAKEQPAVAAGPSA